MRLKDALMGTVNTICAEQHITDYKIMDNPEFSRSFKKSRKGRETIFILTKNDEFSELLEAGWGRRGTTEGDVYFK